MMKMESVQEIGFERRRFLTEGPAGELEVLFEPSPKNPEVGPTAVVCHPHPQGGGTLENKVVYTAAKALREAGYHTLRFNFRGTGKSGGVHDGTGAEQEDVKAILALAREFAGEHAPLILAGFSFGAWCGLPAGEADERVQKLIGIGLALGKREFTIPQDGEKPLLVIQGTSDEFSTSRDVYQWVERRPGKTRIYWADTDHFFHGHLDEITTAIEEFLGDPSDDLA